MPDPSLTGTLTDERLDPAVYAMGQPSLADLPFRAFYILETDLAVPAPVTADLSPFVVMGTAWQPVRGRAWRPVEGGPAWPPVRGQVWRPATGRRWRAS